MRVPKRDRIQPDLIQSRYKYDVQTSPDDPTLPAAFVFSGARGSGKTYACLAMCKKFEEKGYITRTFLISPRRESNTLFDSLSTLANADTCDKDDYGPLFLKFIMDEVKSDWEEYKSSKVYKKVWQKHMEGAALSLKEEYMLEEKGYREPVYVSINV